ncbi:unnamed protein product [Amaranthus hypochondriacus]
MLPSTTIATLKPLLLHSSHHLLHHLKSTKNPNKTHQNPQFQPILISSITMLKSSSWSCPKCTFLNPPSQLSSCQICLTPFSHPSPSSSSSPLKWACKACTFLNSYSRSNCEICDTRNSINFQELDSTDPDDDLTGPSSVGSVFFPLRRCNTGRVDDDVGLKETVQIQSGSDQFVDQGIQFGGSRNKRKLQDPDSENVDALRSFTAKKKENDLRSKGVTSAKIDNADDRATFKRKLCDLSNFIDKPINVDGFREVKSSKKMVSVLDSVNDFGVENLENLKEVSNAIKILSYNVWFAEDLEVHRRMQAIGDLIQLHAPDVICLQEITPNIYNILQNSTWWKKYRCSVSYERATSEVYFCMQLTKLPVKSFRCEQFSLTRMGRELCVAEMKVYENKSLVVATSHLESPSPGPPTWDQMNSKERVNQAKEAVNFLKRFPNVVFCGDMNWDDKLDGQFPCAEGWFDAWEKLRPTEIGYTYDTKSNKMLTGNRSLRKRLDRFICCLTDFEVCNIDMIGTEEIPNLTYSKTRKIKNKIQELTCPVLPSDHFGLLLTITSMK